MLLSTPSLHPKLRLPMGELQLLWGYAFGLSVKFGILLGSDIEEESKLTSQNPKHPLSTNPYTRPCTLKQNSTASTPECSTATRMPGPHKGLDHRLPSWASPKVTLLIPGYAAFRALPSSRVGIVGNL